MPHSVLRYLLWRLCPAWPSVSYNYGNDVQQHEHARRHICALGCIWPAIYLDLVLTFTQWQEMRKVINQNFCTLKPFGLTKYRINVKHSWLKSFQIECIDNYLSWQALCATYTNFSLLEKGLCLIYRSSLENREVRIKIKYAQHTKLEPIKHKAFLNVHYSFTRTIEWMCHLQKD